MLILLITLCILVITAIVLIIAFRPKPNQNLFVLNQKLDDLFKSLDKITANLKEDFKTNRDENSTIAKENRLELNATLQAFRKEVTETLHTITSQNGKAADQINKTLDEKITALINKVEESNKTNRSTITANLKDFSTEQGNKFNELKGEQKEQGLKIVESLDKISNRVEENNKAIRETVTSSLKDFAIEQHTKFGELKSEQKNLTAKTVESLENINARVEGKLASLNQQAKIDSSLVREALTNSFKGFQETFEKNVASFNDLQREKFGQLEDKQNKMVESTERKLEQMRETVEEKLQKTLNERLGQSFEMVRGQLESVQKGLGEMQTLAQDVGGLKRVLSNVKMRGGFGEVQLQMLLENILAPEQYEANVATKKGSIDRVEFAVKFPNREGDREYVWLPIDAKFPKDAYENLQTAYDTGETTLIEAAQKSLESVIKKMAKDICEKYIDAPDTTNFGIMFLPFEGLFAEVVRKASLLEEIQRDCKVIITGPTTLAVILNSLQMGFRTLAIQKRSSEVWQVLGAVKKEFHQFGSLLEKAQHHFQSGLNQLDNVVGVRTRAIQRKLKSVEALHNANEAPVLTNITAAELLEEED